jgi:hypothetical protein
MYNVVTSFGGYPITIKPGEFGPYTSEDLGLMWLKHCAEFSTPGMLSKYRLVLLLPREIVIPHEYDDYLDAWGDKKRFDENNKTQTWPFGPNLVFSQILWLYHYNKIAGPFLWCEPDAIPVRADWLDAIFSEYEEEKKPFMGAFVDTLVLEGQRTPKHMSGNGVYPDKAFNLAPMLMEARSSPFDVYAAKQIVNNCHFTKLIQHERGVDPSLTIVKRDTVLYHPDKVGALINRLGGHYERLPQTLKEQRNAGRPLVEVLAESPPVYPEDGLDHPTVDECLDIIHKACQSDTEVRRKVAYFMLNNGIINSGHFGTFRKRQKHAAAKAEQSSA